MNREVIIVGAGPVGLSLAVQLGKEGKRVLLLEKKPATSEHSKAITIWPATQEILHQMGALKEFKKQALHFEVVKLYDADNDNFIIQFPLKELQKETRFPELLILPQYRTEKILKENVENNKSVELQFNAEVFSIKDQKEKVKVSYRKNNEEFTVSGRFLIGCDGGNSFVRESLKIELKGKTFPFKAGLADIKLKTDKKFHSPRFSSGDHLFIAFYIGDDLWRIIFLKKHSVETRIGEKLEEIIQKLFGSENFEKIWESEFRLHSRTAEKLHFGNIVLAGDAAHLNSPVGGQGMNAGIIDTLRLKEALLKALNSNQSKPLTDYAEKRKKAIKNGVNKNTAFMTSLLLRQNGRYARLVIKSLALALKIGWIRHKFLRKMSLLSA
ncbi:hypothetical protein C7S20_12455 [Christiangramia fulva]|uniref:FAD-binding domain-containing protein n=1 Tax=Christiangramia fulva TaxID=2126553 RepID=A0A2R3Z6U6_9FLAO|nr:NAD(P)/FAD-dependent oxidoreductase [Christiangramia fulva]AVR46000.1 hypothetical protein C7S20_12455 [Christiangramia fulva]